MRLAFPAVDCRTGHLPLPLWHHTSPSLSASKLGCQTVIQHLFAISAQLLEPPTTAPRPPTLSAPLSTQSFTRRYGDLSTIFGFPCFEIYPTLRSTPLRAWSTATSSPAVFHRRLLGRLRRSCRVEGVPFGSLHYKHLDELGECERQSQQTMASWGMGWFGGAATAKKKDAPKNAILQLRSQLEMLSKREKHLQNQMDEQDGIARKYVNSNKNGKAPGGRWNGGEFMLYSSVLIWKLFSHSRKSCVTSQKAIRALTRADKRTNNDSRARNLLHRDRKHQQRNTRRNEECQRGDEEDPRRPHDRQSRPDNVRLPLPPPIALYIIKKNPSEY